MKTNKPESFPQSEPDSPIEEEVDQPSADQASDAEPEELTRVSDVLGFEAPEELMTIDAEAEAQAKKISADPYAAWAADKTPGNLYKVVGSLKPTTDSVLAGMKAKGNPHMEARARVVAAKAIQNYDPNSGTSLATWVTSQMRQLARDNRKTNNVISVPEGVQLDAYKIFKVESEFMDEHDREPTVKELADLSHLSVKRITDVRNKLKPVANESSYDNDEASLLEGGNSDYSKDALDYVYNDSDTVDQKILEYTLGYGGADMLDSKQLMDKLKITPVQLTRRKARLSMRVSDIMRDLETL